MSMDDDPRKLFARMIGAGLLGNRGQFGPGISQGLLGAMQAQQQNRQMKMREAEAAQNQQMRAMQMEQMKRQQAEQDQMRQLAGRAFAQNPAPNDDMGNPMPQAGGGMQEFAQGMMGINPMIGAQFMPKPKGPVALAEGGRLVDPTTGREIAANPKRSGPQVGAIREVKSGGNIHTYEWDGQKWGKIASAPQFKPDGPEKPAAPQLYNGPNGPVWVTPPARGSQTATTPVTGPDGKPLPAAKREHPLTESQARGTLFLGQMREAEKAIANLKGFDPANKTSQAHIAVAQHAKEAGPLRGAMMNWTVPASAQRYAQAAEQWSEAFLRIKTGAASTRDEVLRNVRTFFPQPMDDAATVKQKNEARKIATQQMEILASQGVQQLDAQQQSGPRVVNWDDLP